MSNDSSPGTLRVLHVVEAAYAGVGRHVLDLATRSRELGVAVDLYYGSSRAERRFLDRIDLVGFGEIRSTRSLIQLDAAAGVRAMVKQRPVDIVHGHAAYGGAWARIAASGREKIVYTPNAFRTQLPGLSRPSRWTFTRLERLLSHRTDGLIYVSAEESEHGRALRLSPGRSTVIPNGISEPVVPTRKHARDSLGIRRDALVVGFVGRLTPQKGLDLLIDAAPEIVTATGADLAVIGDGPDEQALVERATAVGIASRILWLGPRDGASAMPAFDVLVIPSEYEGFPYVALEALRAGVPVVATETCNLSLLLQDGSAGSIVARDPAGLAQGVIDVIRNPVRRAAMSARARVLSAAFDDLTMTERTIDFYRLLWNG